MFGAIVAVLALAAVGWYFRAMLKPFRRHSEEHNSSGDYVDCGHCSGCPTARRSICNVLHQIEISSEITNPPDTKNN
jgi:hypothetical protein